MFNVNFEIELIQTTAYNSSCITEINAEKNIQAKLWSTPLAIRIMLILLKKKQNLASVPIQFDTSSIKARPRKWKQNIKKQIFFPSIKKQKLYRPKTKKSVKYVPSWKESETKQKGQWIQIRKQKGQLKQ